MNKCPYCKRPNPDSATACKTCGMPLNPHEATRPKTIHINSGDLPGTQPRWGKAYLVGDLRLRLYAPETGDAIEVNFQRYETAVLGRLTPDTGPLATVDLAAFDAGMLGVSRQHARLQLEKHTVYLTDLDSTNATYLNGHRLSPNHPIIVRDGDELRLGDLRLVVTFVQSSERPPA